MKTISAATSMRAREIDRVHIRPWSHVVVDADPPELAITPEFRADMIKARKARGMTQGQLGARVGTSQNIVSLIESGAIETSSYVLPIATFLKIRPPVFYESEEQRAWAELGNLLEKKSPRKFERAMALVEAMLEDEHESISSGDAQVSQPESRSRK